MRCAVIGAGVSGLACARVLQQAGLKVDVFEKSRGVGGRVATRWQGSPASPRCDHGAQFFTVEHPAFLSVVQQAQDKGMVAPWDAMIVDACYGVMTPRDQDLKTVPVRWVGTPGMTGIAHFLADGLPITFNTRIESIVLEGARDTDKTEPNSLVGTWSLATINTGGQKRYLTGYDVVVVAVPAEQAAELLQGGGGRPAIPSELTSLAASVTSGPSWTVMVEFEKPVSMPNAQSFNAAYVYDSPLGWVARDSSKPGRESVGSPDAASAQDQEAEASVEGPVDRWVLQATAAWSETHLEQEPAAVAVKLLDVFQSMLGSRPTPLSLTAHRWRYATPVRPLQREFLWDNNLRLGCCGDWVKNARVESAFLSGHALGQRVMAALL